MTQTEELHKHNHGPNRFAVIPTAEKLAADPRFTGKGITIAFLDSGFFPHPDIVRRISEFHDVAGEETGLSKLSPIEGHHWHGTQTAVVCAGNGKLSGGAYAGLASSAKLVLVKVSEKGSIPDRNIELGLRWVLANRKRLNIRILNMSLGGDRDVRTVESRINKLTEQLVEKGVTVTVAAGNDSSSHSIPPASAPSVITCGGYSDENALAHELIDLYHSSSGITADGLVKPEVIAPAMYVAAPILPGSPLYRTAEALNILASAPDYQFRELFSELATIAGLDGGFSSYGISEARQSVDRALKAQKIVSAHYQHVDGTSFAAPITASVVAQMLEANPALTPHAIKNILISTAKKLSGFPAVRQGYGIICAASAVAAACREQHVLTGTEFSPPRIEGRRIIFTFHDHNAETVSLAGDFNGWGAEENQFEEIGKGLWSVAIPCQAPGRYRYKIVVDGSRWVDDPSHGLKEGDGFGGFNSVLEIV